MPITCGNHRPHSATIKPARVTRSMKGQSRLRAAVISIPLINSVEIKPADSPSNMTKGSSLSDVSSNGGMEKTASLPNARIERLVALTAERMTGIKLATEYSIMTTSIAKITPASGVLKDAAIPAEQPQAIKVRNVLLGSLRYCASNEPEAAPK